MARAASVAAAAGGGSAGWNTRRTGATWAAGFGSKARPKWLTDMASSPLESRFRGLGPSSSWLDAPAAPMRWALLDKGKGDCFGRLKVTCFTGGAGESIVSRKGRDGEVYVDVAPFLRGVRAAGFGAVSMLRGVGDEVVGKWLAPLMKTNK